jgi:hypothetical protein
MPNLGAAPHDRGFAKKGRGSKRIKKKNYAGSKTLPASIKEKETHWPEVP